MGQLAKEKVAPKAAQTMAGFHAGVVETVAKTVAQQKVVVVGMAQNPFVKKARKALEGAGIQFEYLEYGSYLSQWKQRLAIKLWSGWPTFPQVFVNGVLIGGFDHLSEEIKAGTLKK